MPLTDKNLSSLPHSFFFFFLLPTRPRLSQANRLTPDFPEALYELLCTLQEGRRLNDQRCSFKLEGGMRMRRCHSEPNASKPANRGGTILRKARLCFHAMRLTRVGQVAVLTSDLLSSDRQTLFCLDSPQSCSPP